MQTIEDKIHKRIRGKGRAWAFSDTDFKDIATGDTVRQSLSRLTKKGRIRRVVRGVYDYPKYSKMLKQLLSPDLNQIAQALARKFGWRIQPSGDTALNVLGISTQIPNKMVYLSDGPNRIYKVGHRQIVFQKNALKYASLKIAESALIVQALSVLQKERIDGSVIKKIRDYFEPAIRKKILKDARVVNGWIYELIRQICSEENRG
ncbi:MAG: hypothetical protein HQL24_08840 [Candidatus Omnitrophica bacterium]|nr:hypothetical protein [Candidatus Omnitrophota bacterium]